MVVGGLAHFLGGGNGAVSREGCCVHPPHPIFTSRKEGAGGESALRSWSAPFHKVDRDTSTRQQNWGAELGVEGALR